MFREKIESQGDDNKNNSWYKFSRNICEIASYISQYNSIDEMMEYFETPSNANERIELVKKIESKGIFLWKFKMVCNWLKDIGVTGFSKPDNVLTYIFTHLGLADENDESVFKAVDLMASANNVSVFYLDRIFWLIGTSDSFVIKEIGRKKGKNKEDFVSHILNGIYLENKISVVVDKSMKKDTSTKTKSKNTDKALKLSEINDIVKEWIINKEKKNEISFNPKFSDDKNKTNSPHYIRYRTNMLTEYIPDDAVVDNEEVWVKRRYHYEIKCSSKSIVFQLALHYDKKMPPHTKSICNSICNANLSDKSDFRDSNFKWPCILEKITVDKYMNYNRLISELEDKYAKMKTYEGKIIAFLKEK